MGLFKEKATVKVFRPAQGKKRMFAFVTLNEKDGRDVFVGQDVLDAAKITELSVGQTVKIKHVPSDKRPGTLQATVISA